LKITLVRHLQPLVETGFCYGRLDLPLHPAAMETIEEVAARSEFQGACRIWSSPARRCLPLAEAIAAHVRAPLDVDPRLQELHFGEWEGQPWSSIERSAFDRWSAEPRRFAPPGGESGEALVTRVGAVHAELRARGEACVVVSHAGPLKVLMSLLRQETVNLFARSPPFGAVVSIECAADSALAGKS
jgi:alpha-ribazole phosphatase